METPTTRNLVTGDNTLLAAVAEATLKSPMRLFGVCHDLDNEIEDSALEFLLDAAVAALERRAKRLTNRFPRTDLRRPVIFCPMFPSRGGEALVDDLWPAQWLPLNDTWCPLGLDVRPYEYPTYAHLAWRFKVDPRTLAKSVWSPRSAGDGWLHVRTRNYGACLKTILRATEDPLSCLQSLFDDGRAPPPLDASALPPRAPPPDNDGSAALAA